jgi:hypothetical protein
MFAFMSYLNTTVTRIICLSHIDERLLNIQQFCIDISCCLAKVGSSLCVPKSRTV